MRRDASEKRHPGQGSRLRSNPLPVAERAAAALPWGLRARRRNRRGAPLLIAGGAVCALLLGSLPASNVTEAAWTDTENAGATFTVEKVPAPVSTADCSASTGLLGAAPTVTIRWRAPAASTGYSLAQAEFGALTKDGLTPLVGDLIRDVVTQGTPSAYTTVASGKLLSGLLGGTVIVAVRFVGPGGWQSDWLVATAENLILGLGASCKLSTQTSAP